MRDHIKVPTIARWQKGAACSDGGRPPVADQSRPHPTGCTLFFPFRDLVIGATHSLQTNKHIKAHYCGFATMSPGLFID